MLIAAGVFVAPGSSVSLPKENPAIINLVDYSTVPPSSYESNSISMFYFCSIVFGWL